jgi:hypothetical protein
MVLDTEEDVQNGADWSDFASAWRDQRLSCDTLYGDCMRRWLECFPRDRFLLLDSKRMRDESSTVLAEVAEHFGVEAFDFDLHQVHNANTADDRRPLTFFGRGFRLVASMVPKFLKGPLVSMLQKRGVNIYKMPVLSKRRMVRGIPDTSELGALTEELRADLELLEGLTGFDTSAWRIENW